MSSENGIGGEIRVLRSVEAIRVRAAMYVGDLEQPAAVTKLLTEAVCLALENAATGCASKVEITLDRYGTATIFDNGPGLCVHSAHGSTRSAVDMIFTELYAYRAAKKHKTERDDLCDIGIVCTNALSEWLSYETVQDGGHWRQQFSKGKPVGEVEYLGFGTTPLQQIRFKPDPNIFGPQQISTDLFIQWYRQLNRRVEIPSITIRDARNGMLHQL